MANRARFRNTVTTEPPPPRETVSQAKKSISTSKDSGTLTKKSIKSFKKSFDESTSARRATPVLHGALKKMARASAMGQDPHPKPIADAGHVKPKRPDPVDYSKPEKGKWLCPPRKHPEKTTKRDRGIQKFKNINFSRDDDDDPNLQLTVQNLEFPDVNIKRTELHKRDNCGRCVVPGRTGRDFDSTSNSHFRDGIQTVNMRKRSCTSSSMTDSVSASRLPSERPSSRYRGFVNSEEMIDSQHLPSERVRRFRGDIWKRPCTPSFVAGAPKPRVGICPETYEELAKLTAARQKFFLTQDPRKTTCLINPQALRHKPLTQEQEFNLITKTIKQADNICMGTESEKSESYICEVIDLENPLGLDFQGMDYKINYEKDEQELQNQLTYWRVTRYMERKRVKKSTKNNVETQLQEERLAMPAAFSTTIKDELPPPQTVTKEHRLCELYRGPDKPRNIVKIEDESKRRAERYKDIYLRNKQRELDQELERLKQAAAAKEIEARTVAESDLQHDVDIIDDAIERSFRKHVEIVKIERQLKHFPKTLGETERLKKVMHKENCVLREKARVEQQFFLERTGKLKAFPEADLQMACEDSIDESVGATPSEQSSDDEDYLVVGKVGNNFQLRGFHFKHGEGLRGKLHRHQIMKGQRTVKGCLTRDEWLAQLVPRRERIKLDVETGIIKVLDPDDPNLDLFPPEPHYLKKSNKKSAVREYIDKKLGMHYHRLLRKNLRIVNPKLKYHVKKFNLIRYVFPEKPLMDFDRKEDELNEVDMLDPTKVATTVQYMKLKENLAKAQHEKEKKARMKLLGLPCLEVIKSDIQSPCEVKEVLSDPDWVPPPEPPFGESRRNSEEDDAALNPEQETLTAWRRRHQGGQEKVMWNKSRMSTRSNRPAPSDYGAGRRRLQGGQEQDKWENPTMAMRKNMPAIRAFGGQRRRLQGGQEEIDWEKPTMAMRGNMPAPKEREYTFFLHPRRKRDYKAERVPSELFFQNIAQSGIPLLEKLPPDKIMYANVRNIAKRPYTSKFEARHHHDHWQPTQTKRVHVHYQTKTVFADITHTHDEEKKEQIINFVKANPPCKVHINKDLSLPQTDFEQLIADHLAATRVDSKDAAREVVQDLCHPYDFVFHSREPDELAQVEFPGRRQYQEFLRETREALYEAKEVEPGEERVLIDRKAFVADLEEDLKSIEGCLTSLSSSDCTDLTNDSGSYLLIEGKTKLPLDYIRKPLVPFEELHRSRFRADPIDVDAEEQNPYRMLPFSGQHKEQATLLGPKDTFFTFSTRLHNGLRLRLEVPVPDVRTTLLGPGSRKYYGAVITDLDENYIEELKSRATIKTFNFKSGIELLKDAMRLKYESLLIQGQMVRTKIYDRLNERHWQNMKNTKNLYEALFAKWEKKEYNAAMTLVYQVKSYYETTDLLKQEFRDLERELMMLNMDIVFIEGHWIRCIMLQNFHYLLGEQEWRMENDWIHRVPKRKRKPSQKQNELDEGEEFVDEEQELEMEEEEEVEYELEPYDESIAKRAIVNIRVRDKDDAWAIRAFYYDVYMQNLHPILQVFPDADSFLLGIDNLKTKTFMLLLEMHFTLSIHTELQGRLETFTDWCEKDLKEKQEYVARKSAKKFFMEDRAIEMESRVHSFLSKPIEQSFADEDFNQHRAIIAEVWRRVVPATVRGSSDVIPNPADMVAAISDVVMELLGKFEHMDIDKVREVEAALRKRRRYLEKLSLQAYQVERRIEMDMKKVKRNLEPPYKKPKRVGRLPRLYLRKKVKESTVVPVTISEHTKFFVRAFREDDVDMSETFARDSLMVVDNMQEQIVPFYFDHFLRINGYTPNYNFKTNIESRDGPELNRFRVRDVIPDVLQKLEHWEFVRKKIMEENIQRNPRMYENVM